MINLNYILYCRSTISKSARTHTRSAVQNINQGAHFRAVCAEKMRRRCTHLEHERTTGKLLIRVIYVRIDQLGIMEKALCAGECPCGTPTSPCVCLSVQKESDCRGEKMQSAHSVLMWFVGAITAQFVRTAIYSCIPAHSLRARRTHATNGSVEYIYMRYCAWILRQYYYSDVRCAHLISGLPDTCKCLRKNM